MQAWGRTDNDKGAEEDTEGISEKIGRLRGKRELLEKLSDKFSIEQISEMLEIDISELKNIMKRRYRTKSICKKLLVAGSVGSSFILMHGHIIRTVRYVYQDIPSGSVNYSV